MVKVMGSPSAAPASAIVTVALLSVPPSSSSVSPSSSSVSPSSSSVSPSSSSVMVPVAGSPVVTPSGALETLRPTVNVSSSSTASSWVVATVRVCVSPALPAKVRAVVLGV